MQAQDGRGMQSYSSFAQHNKDDSSSESDTPELSFVALPFEHPVYIMFSSGTTGQCAQLSAG